MAGKMDSFTECYDKAKPIAKDFAPFTDYKGAAKVGKLGMVMGVEGPKREFSSKLDNLRWAIFFENLTSNKSVGDVIVKECEAAGASGFGAWLSSVFSNKDLADRCATMKMLAHLYLRQRRGAQDVWIYSPPKAYKKWVFDECKGLSKSKLSKKLDKDEEVYSSQDFKVLGDATTMALKWSMMCIVGLAFATPSTDDVVKFWFLNSGASAGEVKAARTKLLSGFFKIINVLNSNHLVLSDEPIDRAGGGWKDYAFVYQSEKLDVIYVQNATLQKGKSGHMWLAALTLVHELSHRELKTDDHRYDSDSNLSPQAAAGLTPAKAIDNADNWGYFAADLNGMLMPGKKKSVSGVP